MTRRVVITGMGPISAAGLGMAATWDAMVAGRSAIARIESFDPAGYQCQIAGEVRDFKANKIVPKHYRKAVKVMARDIELAVGAADLAKQDACFITKADGEAETTYPASHVGAHIGAGLIAAELDELTGALAESRDEAGNFDIKRWGAEGMNHLTPLWLLKYLPNMLACHVTIIHGSMGPSNTITCGEASSGLSAGESLRVIQRGQADACFCGGAESKVNPMAYLRQEMTGRLNAAANDTPADAVRPYSQTAAGAVIGEGGAILLLEALETLKVRQQAATGDKPVAYAEIVGFGAGQNIHRESRNQQPDPAGRGITVAMRAALREAQITPADIDAILPFAIGAEASDAAEAAALRTVFGDALPSIPLILTKPFIGNCGAGAGGIDLCVAAKALVEQQLPARINTTDALPGLNAAAAPAAKADLKHILLFAGLQGGQVAALILRRFQE